MKFRELQSYLSTLTEEQLDCDVSIYGTETDECFEGIGFGKTNEILISLEMSDGQAVDALNAVDGVLDDGHPFIVYRG